MTGLLDRLGWYLAALTPHERFEAMGRFDRADTSFLTDKWFVLFMASIVFMLTMILIVVRRQRISREIEASEESFNEYADRCGLSAQEREILSDIGRRSGVRHKEAIFTIVKAFDRGSAGLMQESFSSGQNIVARKKLNSVVNSIREKLGFKEKTSPFGAGSGRRRSLSSRSIGIGKKVSLALAGKSGATRIDGEVIKNDDLELVIRPEMPLASMPGEMWNIHYRFGGGTWEFDALTMVCDGDLELSHTENIRFVNRRRFLRVAVKRPALVACFPICCSGSGALAAPKFVSATVTELSGPGLRIETDLKVKIGERVLVVFDLEDGKIIEDIGQVRGGRDTVVGHSIGVELIGLNDAGVDELVRATNNIAIRHGMADLSQSEAQEPVLAGEGANG